jgi:hypothetical protein
MIRHSGACRRHEPGTHRRSPSRIKAFGHVRYCLNLKSKRWHRGAIALIPRCDPPSYVQNFDRTENVARPNLRPGSWASSRHLRALAGSGREGVLFRRGGRRHPCVRRLFYRSLHPLESTANTKQAIASALPFLQLRATCASPAWTALWVPGSRSASPGMTVVIPVSALAKPFRPAGPSGPCPCGARCL